MEDGSSDGSRELGDILPHLLQFVSTGFGNTLSKFGRDLFLIDGDALLAYMLAEEAQVKAFNDAHASRTSAEQSVLADAAIPQATRSAPGASVGHPVSDFQMLPIVFRVEQMLSHLAELGAEFRVFFLSVQQQSWRGQFALLRQALVWHLQHCTSFTVDTEVVHPWHASWADYLSLHLPSYVLSFVDWDFAGADAFVSDAAAVVTRAFVLRLLAEGRSVVVLRGADAGGRVDVGASSFDAFWLNRLQHPALLRRCGPESVAMRRVCSEVVTPLEKATLAAAPAAEWENTALSSTMAAGGWRLALAVRALASLLREEAAASSGNNNNSGSSSVSSSTMALASVFLWHVVAMQVVPVEHRAIPATALPLGSLAGGEADAAELSSFLACLSGHLRGALTAASASDVDTAAANVTDLVDMRLFRFLYLTLPASVVGGDVAATAVATFGSEGGVAASAALGAAWSALSALGGADIAAALKAWSLVTVRESSEAVAAAAAQGVAFMDAAAAAAAAAALPAPVVAPIDSSHFTQTLLGGDEALRPFESTGKLRTMFPFPFGDSFCWHRGSDFAKLPEAFDKVTDGETKTTKVLSDWERKKLQRKANAKDRLSSSLAGGVVQRKTVVVKGIWSPVDEARQRELEEASNKGKKGKKGKGKRAKAPKGGWKNNKKGKGKPKLTRADQIRQQNRIEAEAKDVASAIKQLESLEATVRISVSRDKFDDAMQQLSHFKSPKLKREDGTPASDAAVEVNMNYQGARLEVLLGWHKWTLRRLAMGKDDQQAGLGSWSSSPASVLFSAAADALAMFTPERLASKPLRLIVVLVQIFTVLGFTELRNKLMRSMPVGFAEGLRLEESTQSDQSVARFQLDEGGAEMPRSVGSRDDPRTSFRPDAWQAELLDIVDRRESALVVAPTSSGKTFICFYAMERVLEQDDDGVLVYVAPTKQLVNQIDAEVSGRFRKAYRTGRQLSGVFTRDYQSNVDTCQILITVPERAEILLMSPAYVVAMVRRQASSLFGGPARVRLFACVALDLLTPIGCLCRVVYVVRALQLP